MRNIWHIALHNLRLIASDRGALFWLIVMPLVFTAAMGFTLRGGGGRAEGPTRYALTVANLDTGAAGKELLDEIAADDEIDLLPLAPPDSITVEERARELVRSGDRSSVLLIPEDYSERLAAGTGTTLEFMRNPERMQPFVARQVVERLIARRNVEAMASDGVLEAYELVRGAPTQEVAGRLATRVGTRLVDGLETRMLTVRSERVGRPEAEVPEMGFTHSAPAMALMFVLLNGLMLSSILVAERRDRTLTRLMSAPIRRGEIITANLLWRFLIGLVQMGALILFGRLVFGVDWGDTLVGLALVSASYVAAVAGLSVLIGSLSRTSKQAESLSLLLALTMCALGGLWWPLEITPRSYQAIGHLIPTGWAMDAMNNMLSRGYALERVIPQVLVLCGFAVVFAVAATMAFRYE